MWRGAGADDGVLLLVVLSLTERPSAADDLLEEEECEGRELDVVAINQVACATRLVGEREAFSENDFALLHESASREFTV